MFSTNTNPFDLKILSTYIFLFYLKRPMCHLADRDQVRLAFMYANNLLSGPFQPDNMAAHVSLLSLLQHGLANITSDNPGAVWGQQLGELTASAPKVGGQF